MKSAPAGQLGGRAGRKCTLEDGERFLLRAIEVAHLYLVICSDVSEYSSS
jgi:hypothetical protein